MSHSSTDPVVAASDGVVPAGAIECTAQPIDRPRARQSDGSSKGDFVILGFLLVLFLKIVGLLIVSFWLARRFPKTCIATIVAIPFIGAIARRRLSNSRNR